MTARTVPAMNHRSPQSNVLTPRTRRPLLAGLIPVKIVWELTLAKVGNYNAYVTCFNRMFSINKINRRGPLEAVGDVLLRCSSIDQAQKTLFELEAISMTVG